MAVTKERVKRSSRRYYDPATAQLTTPDLLFAITGERYGYAGNDPVNGSDPTGLCGPFGNGACPGASTVRHVAHDVAAAPGHIAHTVNNDVVKPVVRNRGTIATGLAIGVCIGQPELCAAATVAAYGFRAEQRVQDNGWNGSWKTNLLDLGVTAATLGVGNYLEGLEGFPAEGTLARRLYAGMYAFPDIASFLEGRLTGEDAVEALTGYGEGCQ